MQDERGDIISSWLVQLLLMMATLEVVGYEVLSIGITTLTLDGEAERVAGAAADRYELDEDRDAALAVARAEASTCETAEVAVTRRSRWAP